MAAPGHTAFVRVGSKLGLPLKTHSFVVDSADSLTQSIKTIIS
jgi:precorrin-3B methylase